MNQVDPTPNHGIQKTRGGVIPEDVQVVGNVDATTFSGIGDLLVFNTLYLTEQSADPANPPDGMTVIWMSDGTASGDDGDVMAKVTAGGSTGTATIIDKSAL